MEYWDLYTRDRVKTGERHLRGSALPEERFHLVVHVWIRNAAGQYLISQRAASRPTHPLMWETVGGSVLMGEDSLHGALREVKEEIGVDLEPQKGQLVLNQVREWVRGEKFNDILDVWLFPWEGEATLADATTDEVADVRWATAEEIRKLVDEGRFVDTLVEEFFGQPLLAGASAVG